MRNSDYNAFIRRAKPDPSQNASKLNAPLAQLTFATKDNIAICDWPVTCGSSSPIIARCSQDAEIVTKLKQNGAVFLGSTNMDELGLTMTGYNDHFGNAINPRDPELICGGSSSGSAAAVAGALCSFAIGTDFGGSLRFPAAACGIFGLKITAAKLDQGLMLFDREFDSIGVVARELDVIGRVLDSLVDSVHKSSSGSTVLLLPELNHQDIEPGIDQGFNKLCTNISGIFEFELLTDDLNFNESHLAWKTLAAIKIKNYLGSLPQQVKLPPIALASIKYADQISSEQILLANKTMANMKKLITDRLTWGRVLITPVLTKSIPTSAQARTDSSLGEQSFLTLANLLSLPSLTVPTRFGPILLTGGRSSETVLVDLAKRLLDNIKAV